jgi:hypothetical protein
MQPRNEEFFTLFSKAGSNVVESAAKGYRLFFSFLWQRGKYWHEADPDDLLDWEAWRRAPNHRCTPGWCATTLPPTRAWWIWSLSHSTTIAGARGKAACVAKQVTRPIRNREARVTEPQLA